jgi:hypothetical protein
MQNDFDKFEFGGTALSLAAEASVISSLCMHETIRGQGQASRAAHRTQAALTGAFCHPFGPTR